MKLKGFMKESFIDFILETADEIYMAKITKGTNSRRSREQVIKALNSTGSQAEAAKELNVCYYTINKYIRKMDIKFTKHKGRRIYE